LLMPPLRCHSLRILELTQLTTSLRGGEFPCLEVLKLESMAACLFDIFPSLVSLMLKYVEIKDIETFEAPALRELSFEDVENANQMEVGLRVFPDLQQLVIRNPPNTYNDDNFETSADDNEKAYRVTRYPSLAPCAKRDGRPVLVLVGVGIPDAFRKVWAANFPHWVFRRSDVSFDPYSGDKNWYID